jgi:uncharacterized membrane protein
VTLLTLALFAFVGTHFLMSHPLREPMVARLGTAAFQGVYSLVSLATLGWAAYAFREAPLGMPLWIAGDGLNAIATAIMFVASVLLAGSFVGNPALPAPGAKALATQPARGVFAITRHPMMWSFALWSLAHVTVSPRPAVLVLSGFIALLAIGGAAGQDHKKAKLMGENWEGWVSRTAFVPFSKGFAWPGRIALVGGTLLWLIATFAHPFLGAPTAGLWIWLG